MSHRFSREELLIGSDALNRLRIARVAVFGAGGVGSYVIEALARGGVGAIDIIDGDTVSLTNINRQLIALEDTVGRSKVEVAKERVLQINPECNVRAIDLFFSAENDGGINFAEYDYIADAIDTVSSKIELIMRAKAAGTPIISCMGTGNKLNPMAFKAEDISKTSVCPLARVMRRELKKRGVDHLKVVYSEELARTPLAADPTDTKGTAGRPTPGSMSFVPGAAGLLIAGEIIKDLTGIK